MIKALTDLDEIITILAKHLKEQSELDDAHIFNGKSIRGSRVSKQLGQTSIWASFSPRDCFVIFEVEENTSGDDMTEAQEFGETKEILMFTSYKFRLHIYGEESAILSKKLKARFESEQVIQDTFDDGILIQKISSIQSGDDFINDTFWYRRDMDINIAVRLDVSYKKDLTDFDVCNTITVEPK